MTIRITQSMLYRQSLEDIRRNLFGSTRLQNDIATGVRIHRPSDDPSGMLRLLPLQNEVRNLDRSLDNISKARETLNTATASLEDASEIMQRVREIALQGANGTLSEDDRVSLAAEVDQILTQMVSVGNSTRGGRFIFGGTATESAPFDLVRDAGGMRVVYRGNQETLSVEVAPSIETELNLPGNELFQRHRRGATSFEGSTGAASAAGIDSGTGVDQLQVTFQDLVIPGTVTGIAAGSGTTNALGTMNYSFTAPNQISINGGPVTTVTAGDNSIPLDTDGDRTISLNLTLPITPATGSFTSRAALSIDGGATTTSVDFSSSTVRVSDSLDNSTLNVDVSALTTTGNERIRYEGTFDAFSTLIGIRDILQNDEGLDQATLGARLTQSLSDIDTAHDEILKGLRDLGFRSGSMSLLENRINGLKLNTQESVSLVQDTDIVEAMIEYNRQDTFYQASLAVSARVVSTSLLNFL